jgi:hypothetical protein
MSSTLPHVDTVLIVYIADHTTAEAILYDHKNMHPKMTNNVEIENNKHISLLELDLNKNCNEITLSIY